MTGPRAGTRSLAWSLAAIDDLLRRGETGAPALRGLGLVVTTACTLRCTYCYQRRGRPRSMRWEVARAALDLLLGSGNRALDVTFHGGEALLVPRLVAGAMEYVTARLGPERTIRFAVGSNGTGLDARTLDLLARHRVHLQLGFDGVHPAQELRAPGTFAAVDHLLRTLAASMPDYLRCCVTVQVTLTGANARFLGDSVRYLLGLGVRSVHVAPLITHDRRWSQASEEELEAQLAGLHSACLEFLGRYGDVPLSLFREAARVGTPARPSPPCGAASGEHLVVDVDGAISGCIALAPSMRPLRRPLLRRAAECASFGHVLQEVPWPPPDAWAAQPLADRVLGSRGQRHTRKRRCDTCEHLEECHVCPVSSCHIPGNRDHRLVPDNQCAFNRVVAQQRRLFAQAARPAVSPAFADMMPASAS